MTEPSRSELAAGRFELLGTIAEGGTATLYLARLIDGAPPPLPLRAVGPIAAPPAGGLVAVKMIREELSARADFANLFLDEARILSRVRHPGVVALYEAGMHGARIFLAMELLLGQTLLDLWTASKARGARVPDAMLAWIGARTADALHAAHEASYAGGAPLALVHRDVTPSNIFLTFDGMVKVIDFGLAKARGRVSRTGEGIIKGKLAYMAPEQASGSDALDRRVDVFALGATLWELTLDKRLFKRATDRDTVRAVQAGIVDDPRSIRPDYPEPLRRAVLRALARDREERHGTAAELGAELDAFAREHGPSCAADVAALMSDLFAEEHGRQLAWLGKAAATHHFVREVMKTIPPPT